MPGDARLAARLAAAARTGVHGDTFVGPGGQALFDRHLAAARAQTASAEWDEAWAAGAALTIEQAAADALGRTRAAGSITRP